MRAQRGYRQKSIPWFRKSGWGTIYIMRSERDPSLFKVGFTRRRTKERRAELREKVKGELKIVYSLSMHHAYIVEQIVLRGLRRRYLGRADPRGTEWFYLRKFESVESIKRRIEKAALRVRIRACMKFSWPICGRFKIFNPKIRSRNIRPRTKTFSYFRRSAA